jgi:hypothetical protein
MRFLQRLSGTAILIGLFTGCVWAQEQSFSRPVLGFTVDQTSSSISPILGVVGASVVDQRLDFGFEIRNSVISPEHNYALALRSEDQKILVFNPLESPTVLEVAPELHPGPGLIAISPKGTAAAFLNHASGFLQVFSGMPNLPEKVYEFDTSVIPGEATALAVSDDGNVVLINFADGDALSNTAWVTSSNGSLWAVPSSHVSSMSFLPRRREAIFSDAETQEVFLVIDLDGAGNRIPLISFDRPAGTAMNVAASQDARSFFIVSAGFPEVTVVDAETHAVTAIDCSCSPTSLERLKENALLLDKPPADLLHVLDLSGPEPRIVVIPVKRETTTLEGSEEQ